MADTYDPTVVRGDTLRWQMALQDASGISYDLTGATLSFQVRKSYYPSAVLFQTSLYVSAGNTLYTVNGVCGGLSATATGGLCNVCVGSSSTISFSPYANPTYDIQAVFPNNSGVTTLLRGSINVLPDVTHT